MNTRFDARTLLADMRGLRYTDDKRIQALKSHISKVFQAIALIYILFPFHYIPVAWILYEISLQKMLSVLLSPFFYIVCLLAMISGYALWELKRYSWYLFCGANILILYENAVLLTGYGSRPNRLSVFLISVVLCMYFIYRTRTELYVPYFFPRIRWWESSAESRAVTLSARIEREGGSLIDAEILDFSRKGCFIKIREDFKQDEEVNIAFKIQGQPFTCPGMVVWKTQSSVTHPKGIGVKFKPRGIRGKRKMAALERKARSLPLRREDSFEQQLSHFT
jgi:hypothetical protein